MTGGGRPSRFASPPWLRLQEQLDGHCRRPAAPPESDGRICRGDGRIDIVRDGQPMTVTCQACGGRGCQG